MICSKRPPRSSHNQTRHPQVSDDLSGITTPPVFRHVQRYLSLSTSLRGPECK